jgi:Uma2 family endonuclease
MLAHADKLLSIEEFYVQYADQKAELVDGRVRLMSGAARRHNEIAGNVLAELHGRFKGDPCRVYGSDMGVKTGSASVRYPDVVVTCDPRDIEGDGFSRQHLEHPKVLFEVLSPSTERGDRSDKLMDHKALPSVETGVLVNPRTERIDTYERVGELEWRNLTLLSGAALTLLDPALTLTAEMIFA